MNIKKSTIAIVGLGLMGGSLAMALRKQFPGMNVCGVSRSRKKIALAKRKKIICAGYTTIKELAQAHTVDMYVIATPVSVIEKTLTLINAAAQPGTIVTDMGSTKQTVCRWGSRTKLKNIHFIGSHPMAGSHEAGLSAAHSALYANSFCFIVKDAKTNRKAFAIVKQLWESIKIKTIVLSAKEHDDIVSKVSHLPHIAALCLVDCVVKSKKPYRRFASTGFKDTTRIAQSEESIWIDILMTNNKNIARDIKALIVSLKKIAHLLDTNDRKRLYSFLGNTSKKRKSIT